MKYYINGKEYSEIEFNNTFLGFRFAEEEVKDLGLILIRSWIQHAVKDEAERNKIYEVAAKYEVDRCFKNKIFYTIDNVLFERKPEKVEKVEEEKE